ncbi:MAG: YncE family protein [Gemmatimonadota bacterium]
MIRDPAAPILVSLALIGFAAHSAARLAAQEVPPGGDYYVYAAAESEDEVALIRFGPAGAAVAETIAVGLSPTEIDGPHGIVVDPAAERWYVSIAHGNPFGEIHAYSTADNRRIGQARVGLFPATMSISSSGLMFVVNFNLHGDPVPSTVSVVETNSMTELAQLPVCETPHGSRLTTDGRLNYFVCVRDDQLVELDVHRLEVARRLYTAPGRERALPVDALDADEALGAAAAPRNAPRCGPTWAQPSIDGRFVYVACNRNAEVIEVDTGAWEVSRRFATGAGPYNLDVSPDGRWLVVTYKGAQATGVIDLDSGDVRTVANTRRLPHGVAMSPDSRYAFVSVEGIGGEPGTVDVVALESARLVGSVDMGKQAGGIGFWKFEPTTPRGATGEGG